MSTPISLQDLMNRAEEIRVKYEESNAKNGRDAWRIRDYTMAFAGDLGALTKVVMTKENLREDPEADAKLGSKLSDCLNDILILANYYNIDLEKEYLAKLELIDRHIEEKNA